ncbi:MAG: tetratricopeptide repeat protein [Dehalococcoidia bacterium]
MVARPTPPTTPIPLYAPARTARNLPLQPTPLIGRDDEIAALRQRLLDPDIRLLTLTGPPGTGKTRLALAVADAVSDEFPDGVWFVALETMRDSDAVIPAISQTLDLRRAGARSPWETVIAYLRERQILLVLDNFEQLLPAGLTLAEMLAACPRLTVLVTSRAPLRLRWEQEAPVPPLVLPDPAQAGDREAVAGASAVRLFVERATAVRPDFSLTAENAGPVAEICRRLDGLPLAIELAAARVRVLSPVAIRDRLGHRLHLLIGGARDRPARHQTLRTALEWSYDLLSQEEQELFYGLGVFVGGCTLASATAVAGTRFLAENRGLDESAEDMVLSRQAVILDRLSALLEHGLLRREETPDGEPRFRLLETVREYAAERLAAAGAAEAARERHAAYFVALAEQAETMLHGPEQGKWLARLEMDHDNTRAALAWTLRSGDAETALRLCGSLWRSWQIQGRLTEGRRWLDQALAAGDLCPASVRAKALTGAGSIARSQGEYAYATRALEQSRRLWQELGDERGAAVALNGLGVVAVIQGDLARGRALHEECLAILRTLHDRQGISTSLNNLAQVAHEEGDNTAARALLEESLALAREVGDTWQVAATLGNLGEVARRQGDHQRATALLEECTGLYRLLGDKRRLAECLEELAGLAAELGRPERAAHLGGAAHALRENMGAPAAPMEQASIASTRKTARAALGDAAFLAAWDAGRTLPLEEAIALALDQAVEKQPAPPSLPRAAAATRLSLPDGLTPREAEVLALVAGGSTNREIAGTLVLSLGTVERHIANLYAKINARGRADATAYALRHDLLADSR